MLIIGITALAITVSLTLFLAPQLGGKASGERLSNIKDSPNFDNGKFQNTLETPMGGQYKKKFRATLDFIKGSKTHKPSGKLPFEKRAAADFKAEPSLTCITWLGHSAVIIEIDGKRILADPMMGKRASPFRWAGPRRFSKEMPIKPENLPHFDAVIISHDHYDHLDYSTIKKIRGKAAHFFVSLGVGAHLERWGVPENKITELDWEDSVKLGSVKITATPARHFSGRMGIDAFKTLWSSWVIAGQHHKIFFGADSGYFDGFKKIGAAHGPFDLVMLECGAYNPAWKDIHMFPEETAQAAVDLKAKALLPIHWGVFSLAPQAWTEPIERLSKAVEGKPFKLTTPKIGQRIAFGGESKLGQPESGLLKADLPDSKWWEGF